jgi:actin-related protein 5
MLHTFCEFAEDYPSLLRTLKDPLKIRASERIVQFPFTIPIVEEKTEEELTRLAEKKKEQGRKLQEMAAKSRLEKVGSFFFRLSGRAKSRAPPSWSERRGICSPCTN